MICILYNILLYILLYIFYIEINNNNKYKQKTIFFSKRNEGVTAPKNINTLTSSAKQ